MDAEKLVAVIRQLTPEQLEAVGEFIDLLNGKASGRPSSPFIDAAREFMDAHPELLRRLAK
jgi:hypothetical protein